MLQLAHCRGIYYREFAYKTLPGESSKELLRLKLTPIHSDSDLNLLLKTFNTRQGLYVSVYSFAGLTERGTIDYKTAQINRIYLDFDNKEIPQKAIDEALLTVRALANHNKKEVISKFFDLVIETVKEDYENFFGLIVKTVNKGFGVTLETLDHQVRGDITRVSRLPNTQHASGFYCIPVSFGDMRKGIEYIKNMAKQPREYDLENAILKNIMRNEKMPVIINNLEKVAIAGSTRNEKLKELKKQYFKEQTRKFKASGKNSITEDDIEKARSVPLSEFLGHEKMVCCPFHNDSNPSLSIDHKKGLWHCFGCGNGGTTIDFVMKRDGLDFKAAVQKLMKVIA